MSSNDYGYLVTYTEMGAPTGWKPHLQSRIITDRPVKFITDLDSGRPGWYHYLINSEKLSEEDHRSLYEEEEEEEEDS